MPKRGNKPDKLTALMNKQMSELVGTSSKQAKTSTTNGKEGKDAEQYFDLLKKHQRELNKESYTNDAGW